MGKLARWAMAQRAVLFLLVVRLAVGLQHSLSTPIWEADNEDSHFAYARYIALHGTLLQPDDPEAQAIWEKFQPPLYYLTLAPWLAGFNLGPPFSTPELNPYLPNGDAGANYALHPERFDSMTWAVYMGRAYSVLITSLSVWSLYRALRRLWPQQTRRAWAITALYAFWPQLLFTGSMITNDALVVALAVISFDHMSRLLTDGSQPRFQPWRILFLGLALSGALLTKLSALSLVPGALLAVGLSLKPLTRAHRPRWHLLVTLALLGLLSLGTLGILNTQPFVTEQLFNFNNLSRLFQSLPSATTITTPDNTPVLVAALVFGLRTFLASYGWGNLETYPWLYQFWAVAAGGAAVGGLWAMGCALTHRTHQWPFSLKMTGLISLPVVSAVTLTLALSAIQGHQHVPGRYHLAILPMVACLLMAGWESALPRAYHRWLWKISSVSVIVIGWSIPIWSLLPAYAPPPPLRGQPDVPLALRFGDAIELMGYNQPPVLEANQPVSIELCWRARAPITENYSAFLSIAGADGQGYGNYSTYPGRGNYPTSRWQVNVPFCDVYSFRVAPGIPAPAVAEIRISLLRSEAQNREPLPVVDELGNARDAAVPIPVRVLASGVPPIADLSEPAGLQFGPLKLHSYAFEVQSGLHPQITLTTVWEALEDVDEDYALFVHLRDTPTHAYAQVDGPPLANRLPTQWWQKGERFLDTRTFAMAGFVPPPLTLYVGVLNAKGQRLPAFDSQGQPVLNNEAILARDRLFVFDLPPGLLYLPLVQQPNVEVTPSVPYP